MRRFFLAWLFTLVASPHHLARAETSTASTADDLEVFVPPVMVENPPSSAKTAQQQGQKEGLEDREPNADGLTPRDEAASEEGPNGDAREEGSAASTGSPAEAKVPERASETIRIIGTRGVPRQVAGSAQVLGEDTLTRFEHDDVQRVLSGVPGVYVRDEDAFGLRPNIGIRGVSSDRSAKIVLLEDGVLLGPAPYAAPAAYFAPLVTRMVGLEVFKGPAALRTGPFTVGGAINYLTADIPAFGHEGLLDVAAGQFAYGKAHLRYGYGVEHFGFLVEGVRLTSAGFKELDGGGETGFDKNEVMAKLRLNTDLDADVLQRLEIKAGWADEISNETYLGLTEPDFRDDPYRRYRASSLGLMEWERTQIQASYGLFVGDVFEARLTAYRHDFERVWRRINRFGDFVDPRAVLRGEAPDAMERLEILRGTRSSSDLGDAGLILIGTNDRSFVSQGVQVDGDLRIENEPVRQRIRFGARIHYDEVARDHTEEAWEMVARGDALGSLVRTAEPVRETLINQDSALAFSAYLIDEITLFENLIVSPGARVEIIETRREQVDLAAEGRPVEVTEGSDTVLIPGVGVFYQLSDHLGLLAGVHRGFSPVAPGQPEAVEPEASTNYEAGARFQRRGTSAEVIGFFSDYGNLLLTCTFSQGCPDSQVGNQFNAGTIWIYGFEALAHQELALSADFSLLLDGSYTFTLSEFRNAFQTGNPQFEFVNQGDRLPYLPEHRANLSAVLLATLGSVETSLALSYTYVDRMRDFASQGGVGALQPRLPSEEPVVLAEGDFTDVQHVVDLAFQVDPTRSTRFYLQISNLLDEAYLASYRPFGARPGRPFMAQLGFSYRFGADL